MNCPNCGAPLEVVEGRAHFRCPFCATLHFPEPLPLSADRVVPLGRTVGTDCPRCGESLSAGALDDARVRYCATCRGILLWGEDFARLVQSRRRSYRGPDAQPRPLSPEDLVKRLDCPECGQAMEVHPYYGPGNQVIDSCPRCRLVWLDTGELAAIERAPGRR
jgi:Zn-finger nucleic acid-binding protein